MFLKIEAVKKKIEKLEAERKIISKGMLDKALEYSSGFLKESGKAALKEVPEEIGVQFFQNGLDVFALEKKGINLSDGIKDAAAAALPLASANGVYLYWDSTDNTIKARP
mgnify:CR=1 FL=1